MKIGVIFVSYNDLDNVEKSLSPWIHAKEDKLDGNEFVISVVSLPFEQYKNVSEFEEDHTTYKMMETLIQYEKIDYLTTDPTYIKEMAARTLGMGPLLLPDVIQNKDRSLTIISPCDYIIQVDSDELYTRQEISKIFKFVQNNPLITWFRGSLKNYVFSDSEFLEEPFNPARIFKVKEGNLTLAGFYEDNNCFYKKENGEIVYDKSLSSLTIPKNLVWTRHLSWLSNSKSKSKLNYQKARNWICSYSWDEKEDKLIFNQDYFTKHGLSIPTVLKD